MSAPAAAADPYAQLVEAAKTGDRYAVDDLLAALRPIIVRYCRSRIGRALSTFSSADDVAQEVCLAVLMALPSYRSSGASFLGFVYGIATHKIMDFHRKHSRDKSLPVSDVPDTGVDTLNPEQHLLRSEMGQQLGDLLNTLSETQREVLTLRLVVGLSVAETAETISVSPGAVRVCQHRALTKLRNRLQARVGSDSSRTLTLD
ncbi:RNA polymerase sigma factor ShbA [Haloechinothrix halophila]|uniref:RNA polymerase sigma factor ShbA n=1 Tax=Haloechinothrix halophila TaxID=1069073 RepID=UPI000685473A|nr:RNA polymerase sigma factor ShbA [Haloechinothrix halophila]